MTPVSRMIAAAAFGAIAFASSPALQAQTTGSKGYFVGQNFHETHGAVAIQQAADGTAYVVLGEDFSLDGAPDPHVVLARPDNTGIDLGLLRSNDGRQTYRVPAGVDVTSFDRVVIWCERFSVSLGSADLS